MAKAKVKLAREILISRMTSLSVQKSKLKKKLMHLETKIQINVATS